MENQKNNTGLANSHERIQKVLARSGLGSRRQLEKAIKLAQLYVNGKLVELGCKVAVGDTIEWKNRKWIIESKSQDFKIILYNKPLGQICTRKDEKNCPR